MKKTITVFAVGVCLLVMVGTALAGNSITTTNKRGTTVINCPPGTSPYTKTTQSGGGNGGGAINVGVNVNKFKIGVGVNVGANGSGKVNPKTTTKTGCEPIRK